MRLRADQLASHLTGELLPVYLVYGDEGLLVEEASDVIRRYAREQGANERQVWHVEGRFKWSSIEWQEESMSLFSSQRLLEVRLPTGKPGKEGAAVLREYVANPPPDTTLLIISAKIDSSSQKTKWFTEIASLGASIPLWPIAVTELPRWLLQRAQQQGLTLAQDAAALLAERVEGNLFAAAQEIDKLALLYPKGGVDAAAVLSAVGDSARFEAFGLLDTAFAGESAKIPRMLARLQGEGLDILAVFSGISWSLQRAVEMSSGIAGGAAVEQMLNQHRIWDKSKPIMRQVLARHRPQQWEQFLQQMSQIDRAAKGNLSRCPWALLETLCLNIAGAEYLENPLAM